MFQPPDMSLLDDLEDEDVDSKPQPIGKSFYAVAVNFQADRGKIILNSENHNDLAESEDKGEKGQTKAKRSRSKSRSRRNSTLTATEGEGGKPRRSRNRLRNLPMFTKVR